MMAVLGNFFAVVALVAAESGRRILISAAPSLPLASAALSFLILTLASWALARLSRSPSRNWLSTFLQVQSYMNLRKPTDKYDRMIQTRNNAGIWLMVYLCCWLVSESMSFTLMQEPAMAIVKSFLPSLIFCARPIPKMANILKFTLPIVSISVMIRSTTAELHFSLAGVALGVTSVIAQSYALITIADLLKSDNCNIWRVFSDCGLVLTFLLGIFALLFESLSLPPQSMMLYNYAIGGALFASSIICYSIIISESTTFASSIFYATSLIFSSSIYLRENSFSKPLFYHLGLAVYIMALYNISHTYQHPLFIKPHSNIDSNLKSSSSSSLHLSSAIKTRLFMFLIYSFILAALVLTQPPHDSYGFDVNNEASTSRNISAVVFYKQRQVARILNCYLEQNLMKNGGIISEIIFIAQTNTTEDLSFLEYLLQKNRGYYRKIEVDPSDAASLYNWMTPETLYFNVDDDIVYIKDGTFEALRAEKLKDRFLFVSANIVNDPKLDPVHASLGALAPYVPTTPLQLWRRVDNAQFSLSAGRTLLTDDCVKSSNCSMLSHENLFYNIEHSQTHLYEFPLYNFHQFDVNFSWGTNFFIGNSSDIKITQKDAAQDIAIGIPKRLGRHCGAVGKALAARYRYSLLQKEDERTVLERYEELAKQKCGFVLTGDEKVGAT